MDTPLVDGVALAVAVVATVALATTSVIADALVVVDVIVADIGFAVGSGSAPGTSEMWIPGSEATQAPAPATIASNTARRRANDEVTSR